MTAAQAAAAVPVPAPAGGSRAVKGEVKGEVDGEVRLLWTARPHGVGGEGTTSTPASADHRTWAFLDEASDLSNLVLAQPGGQPGGQQPASSGGATSEHFKVLLVGHPVPPASAAASAAAWGFEPLWRVLEELSQGYFIRVLPCFDAPKNRPAKRVQIYR